MKKIFYIVSLALLTIFTSCNYNETNFPGFDQAAIPTNVATLTYTFVAADYTAIGSSFTKIYTDSVSTFKTQLKAATTKSDSAAINAKIDRINLKLSTDSTLVAAANISTNKIFGNLTQASKLIPFILNTKYPYIDTNSSAAVNYNLSYDTTKIVVANKYTLAMADYDAMGTTVNLPGQYDNFSSVIDPNYFIPIYLKKNNSYAVKGDIKLIRYKYFISSSSTIQVGGVYIFDGTNWVNYSSSSQVTKTFVFRGGKWLDLLVFKEGFTKDIGSFTNVSVTGTHKWVWGTYAGVNYMKANAYNMGTTETWLLSPVIDLKDRSNPTVSFDNALDYIAAGMVPTDLASVYISTDYVNDVTKATWTKLVITYPPTAITSYWTAFVNTGKVSLLSYKDKKVTIGLKYVSTGAAMGWEVSNFSVMDE